MIISKTPFRISFVGGGTDLRAFYAETQGAVVSSAVNKYMFITVSRLSSYFDYRIRVSYRKTELVARAEDVRHPIVREALRLVGLDGGVLCVRAWTYDATGRVSAEPESRLGERTT